MMGKAKVCSIVSGVIGLILIIVSMAGFAFFPKIIEGEVNKNLDITDPESEGYKNFVSITSIVPIEYTWGIIWVINTFH